MKKLTESEFKRIKNLLKSEQPIFIARTNHINVLNVKMVDRVRTYQEYLSVFEERLIKIASAFAEETKLALTPKYISTNEIKEQMDRIEMKLDLLK